MSGPPHRDDAMDDAHLEDEEEEAMLDEGEAEETIEEDDNGDAAMDSGDDDDGEHEEIELVNDSIAHFDKHKDSLFCIAQHPLQPEIVATGGGDDMAYVWDASPPERPLLPSSYETNPQPRERKGQEVIATLDGQDESVNAICFTLPKGDYVVTATLAGLLSAYATPTTPGTAKKIGTAKEVEEINWLLPCPHPSHPNTVALGATDGSVWIYTIDASSITIVQTFFLHQASCTAGAWSPDGKLLATVAEDSSLYVWDAFGDAAAAGVTNPSSGQAVIALTAADERFAVEGGLYSAAISPGGGIVAVGGAGGHIRIVGLPRFTAASAAPVAAKGAAARSKAPAGKAAAKASTTASTGQMGTILASLQAQSDGVETLSFSQPPLTLLAAGSVDGSIALFDAAHNFAVRRHIREAHDDDAVIRVEFLKGSSNERNALLTSCGNDGVVRRWDVRGGTAAANRGLVGEWRGHRGGGEGGGVLGFVQGGGGNAIVTAGDDGVGLVFRAD